MRVLGIMSGTSLDGVDYVVCSIDGRGSTRFEDSWQVPFPRALKQRLQAAAANASGVHALAQLSHDLGRFYAAGAGPAARVELAGLHGQTVFHSGGHTARATLQIGEPAYLAEKLNAPIVSNFRCADLAAGGQGAPLATLFHREVFAQRGRHVGVNNLGGISNVTSLDWRRGKEPRIVAFDTGPANLLIDLAARQLSGGKRDYDAGGKLAARGSVDENVLARWLKHPFLRKRPPKSTGREEFGERFFAEALRGRLHGHDLIATLTEFTARSIAMNYRLHLPVLPDEVILCGGGAENPFLFARIALALRELKSNIAVRSSAEYGWQPLLIEGAAFALLAWRTWNGLPGNIPETTGAKGPRVLGQITGAHLKGQLSSVRRQTR